MDDAASADALNRLTAAVEKLEPQSQGFWSNNAELFLTAALSLFVVLAAQAALHWFTWLREKRKKLAEIASDIVALCSQAQTQPNTAPSEPIALVKIYYKELSAEADTVWETYANLAGEIHSHKLLGHHLEYMNKPEFLWKDGEQITQCLLQWIAKANEVGTPEEQILKVTKSVTDYTQSLKKLSSSVTESAQEIGFQTTR